MRKIFIVAIPLVSVLLAVVLLIGFCNMQSINWDYQATQEQKLSDSAFCYSLIDKDELAKIIEKTYYSENEYAGFSSFSLVNPETICEMPWVIAYPVYALAQEYGTSNNQIQSFLCETKYDAKSTGDEYNTPQNIFYYVLFQKIANVEPNLRELENRLDGFYDKNFSMYCYSQNDADHSVQRMLAATFFALETQKKLGQVDSHIQEIKKRVEDILLSESELEHIQNIELVVLVGNQLNCIDKNASYYSDIKKKMKDEIAKFIEDNTYSDNKVLKSARIPRVSMILSACKVLDLEPEDLLDFLKSRDYSLTLKELLCSKEGIQSAIDIENIINEPLLFGNDVESVIEYVSRAFENGYVSNVRKAKTNLMDLYYGMALADFVDKKYDRKKINNTVDFEIQKTLQSDTNIEMYLYFGVLSKKKLGIDLKRKQRNDILMMCDSLMNDVLNDTVSENFYGNVEKILFLTETKKLLNSELSAYQKEKTTQLFNKLTELGIFRDTAYYVEELLIMRLNQIEQDAVVIETVISKLSNNGGIAYFAQNLEDTTTIISTAKVLRIQEVYSMISIQDLIDFLNSFVVEGRLRINKQEKGADLRTYYFYYSILSYVGENYATDDLRR